MEIIFREIKDAYSAIEHGTNDNRWGDLELGHPYYNDVRKKALDLLVKFIDKGDWLPTKGKNEFLNNYKLNVKAYSVKTNREEVNVRQTLWRNSTRLREIFGYDFITRIMTLNGEELQKVFFDLKVAYKPSILLKTFMHQAIIETRGRGQKEDYYKVEELKKELVYLTVYSEEFMKKLQKEIDLDKLAYIINALRLNTSNIPHGREVLVEICKMTKDDVLKELFSVVPNV